jgi:hypothetical protein
LPALETGDTNRRFLGPLKNAFFGSTFGLIFLKIDEIS